MLSKPRRALAAAAILLSMTACGTVGGGGSGAAPAGGNSTITLAGVAGNASDPFWTTLMCGASKKAKELGVDLTWKAAQTASTQEQQTNMDAALLLKPNGLLLGSFQPAQFSARVGQLMQNGTPVVTYNVLQPSTSYQTVESNRDVTDFVSLVTKQIGTSGTVGVLGGQPGIPIIENRWKPVVEQLGKSAPGVRVLDTQFDDFDRNKASTIVSGWIVANPDLKAVYASTGPEGEGAAAAVAQAGKQGQIQVYSFDATPAVVAALRAGTITALSAQSPNLISAKAVENLVDYIKTHPNGGPVQPAAEADVKIPTKILTKDNVDAPESADYLYQPTCDA
jgi:ribose transport system substrate-binding protein